jgi:hypothetical protein
MIKMEKSDVVTTRIATILFVAHSNVAKLEHFKMRQKFLSHNALSHLIFFNVLIAVLLWQENAWV